MVIDITPEDKFTLTDNFLQKYKQIQPPWGPLGEITFRRTYARTKDDGTQEEWWETCKRVVEGTYTVQKWHCRRFKLPWNQWKAQRSAQIMFDLIFNMKFLPPGRGLWMMGTDYVFERGAACLNNCAFISTEHIDQEFTRPFSFLMNMSMLGVGVGGDTKGAGKVIIKEPEVDENRVFVVEDSREGWVSLLECILNSYIGKDVLPRSIDYSKIREKGIPLKSFGGTSSGPDPLKQLVEDLHKVLRKRIGQAITSTDIVDIFNLIGKCVVSGNVRRSAEIMLGNPLDEEFIHLKDPVKYSKELTSHRWASNNSIIASVGMDYTACADKTAKNGEPGYFWLETAQAYGRLCDPPNYKDIAAVGTNPCSEQTLEHSELCCLVETFPSRHETYKEYENTLKYAYLYAKTVTLMPTHDERTNAVQMRNRRIGCSQSGIIENIKKQGLREHFNWCDEGYKYIKSLDIKYSDWLCVPRSKKITSVKPSGTVSLLPGVTPGIHFPHSEYYYRTIRISDTSPLVTALEMAGYKVEKDNYSANTVVAYFPVKENNFYRSKADVSMWEQLELAAQMQYYWADNQVSVTVTFKPEEAKDIKLALELYETRLKSVSFLPLTDHNYEQAPYIQITEEEYNKAVKNLKPVNYKNISTDQVDKYCDSDKCELPK